MRKLILIIIISVVFVIVFGESIYKAIQVNDSDKILHIETYVTDTTSVFPDSIAYIFNNDTVIYIPEKHE